MKYSQLFVAIGLCVRYLDAILNPLALPGILDMHIFDTNGAGVGVSQHAENFTEFHQRPAAETARGKFTV